MDDLATWLRAQLDDDERVAQAVLGVNAVAGLKRGVPAPRWETPEGTSQIRSTDGILRVQHTWAREAEHIARWDPARVLAEVDAKRKLLDWLTDVDRYMDRDDLSWHRLSGAVDVEAALRLLALPYADRDGYREEWRP